MTLHDHDEPHTRPLDAAIIARMWHRLRPYRTQVILNLLITAAIVALELVPPRLTEHIIDANIARNDVMGLLRSIGLLLATVVGIMILARMQITRCVAIGERAVFDLREDIFRHLQALSMSFFDKMKVGRLIARGTSDLSAMRNTMVWALPRIVHAVLILAGTLVMMLILSPRLFVATIVVVPMLGIANNWFRRHISDAWRRVRQVQSRITSTLAENINGVRVIQAYTREARNLDDFQELQTESFDRHMTAARVLGTYLPSLNVIGAIGKSIILVYGGYLVWRGHVSGAQDAMQIGTLVAFVMYQELLFGPIHEMGDVYNEALHAMAGGERIFDLLDEPPAIVDSPGAKELPQIEGTVEFDSVTFGYDQRYPVLHDVSFTARPGQTIALVGPTGAGKSTIVKLVTRFYDIQQGRIMIDGHDIRHVTTESLHRQMGIVSQMNFIFSGTLLDNMRYPRPETTDEEIIDAAVKLGAHEVFDRLPDGYHTVVSERGISLSLGQRQLVCFTRAMVANPRIFILDEATSSVDPQTELRIQNALHALLADRTSFVIAHRLSTIRHADIVMFIDGGRIVERGRHEELIERQGRYYELYQEFVQAS